MNPSPAHGNHSSEIFVRSIKITKEICINAQNGENQKFFSHETGIFRLIQIDEKFWDLTIVKHD